MARPDLSSPTTGLDVRHLGGLAVLVEGENLQFRQPGRPAGRRRDPARSARTGAKFEDACDAGVDQPVADLLGRGSWDGEDRDRDVLPTDDAFQMRDVSHDQSANLGPDPSGIGVQQRGDAEPAGGESRVPGEGLPEVADPDQRDRPVHGQSQDPGNLLGERDDVVSDAADAV